MGKKDREHKEMKLSKDLTPEQRRKFKQFGEPDMSQNWLELFTQDVVNDLYTIIRSCSDNQLKSDYISEELKDLGFEDVGLGTNILVMSNPVYPGVVFKIALDDYGIADNINDCILQEVVPRYIPVFARLPSALVSVQERGVRPTEMQMAMFRPRILSLLKEMSKYFLIADLSPDMFLNYVVGRDGDFRICDGSDLYPLHQIKDKIRCKRITGEHERTGKFKYCEGKLKYSEDFKWLICEKCGKMYNPLELRPKKEVDKMQRIMSDGLGIDVIRTMEADEIAAIKRSQGIDDSDEVEAPRTVDSLDDLDPTPKAEDLRDEPKTIFVYPEEEDEDDEDDFPETEEDPLDNEDKIERVVSNPESSKDLAKTDEDGESEGARDALTSDHDDEEFMSLVPRVQHKAEPSDVSKDDVIVNGDTVSSSNPYTSFTEMLSMRKKENPEVFEGFVKSFVETIGVDYIIGLLKDSPEIQEKFVQIKNESANNVIPGEEAHVAADPSIFYRVVNEDGNPNTLPGIYLNIRGNFEEAFDEYGLPLFVSIDNGVTYTNAIHAGEMLKLISPVIASIKEEEEERLKAHMVSEGDNDDSDEPEVENFANHEFFSGLGDGEKNEEEDDDDE